MDSFARSLILLESGITFDYVFTDRLITVHGRLITRAIGREVKVEFHTVGRVVARQTCNIKMAAWAP